VSLIDSLAAALVPSLCPACARPCPAEVVICARCARRRRTATPLRGAGPPGIDRTWSAAPHEGVARDLVATLKFRALLPVAGLIAERILGLAPRHLLSGELVPVPTARGRSLRRGFDPAVEIPPRSRPPDCRRGPASAAAAPGGRWEGAEASVSAGRRGSRQLPRPHAAPSSSTTSSQLDPLGGRAAPARSERSAVRVSAQPIERRY
jgi:hypothetical protein